MAQVLAISPVSGDIDVDRACTAAPHGGFQHPGYGKDLSMYGFEDYTRIKHVMSYIGS